MLSLAFWGSGSSALSLSSLLLALGYLQAYVHADGSLPSRALLTRAIITSFFVWLQISVCRCLLSFWFSVTFEPARCLLPSQALPLSGIMLRMRNKTTTCFFHRTCPLCSVQTDRLTDKRSDKLPLNDQMWGSLMLAPNNTKAVVSLSAFKLDLRCGFKIFY